MQNEGGHSSLESVETEEEMAPCWKTFFKVYMRKSLTRFTCHESTGKGDQRPENMHVFNINEKNVALGINEIVLKQ